ncbi:MAG: DUF418 domain-containing protein [Chitinophagaceae bacterium]
MQTAAPVSPHERIDILDSLRGIAVLGILLMNIPFFALPSPAQFWDLVVLNEMGTINEKAWLVVTGVFNGTMRALFCVMFGAGIIMFTERKEKKTPGVVSADYYHRRHLWLMLIGLIHLYVLLWPGDYLFLYGCCGLLLFTFRKLSAKGLLIAAFACFVFMITRENVDLNRSKQIILVGEQLQKLDTTSTKLSIEQKEKLGTALAFKNRSKPESRKQEMETSLRKVRGNYSDFYKYTGDFGFRIITTMLYNHIWDLLVFMFIGMAFYKNGFLTGSVPSKVYWVMLIAGLTVGLILSWIKIRLMLQNEFNPYDYTKAAGFNFSEISRVFRSLGIFGFIMLLFKSGLFKWFFSLMKPVGRMAFTNYVTQSILMGSFFYGIGFGMFGKLQRYEIYYVVAVAWVIQIAWSHLWLRYFQFGPFEWVWRQLTYWKRFPIKSKPTPYAAADVISTPVQVKNT